jgi:hypothetical protein
MCFVKAQEFLRICVCAILTGTLCYIVLHCRKSRLELHQGECLKSCKTIPASTGTCLTAQVRFVQVSGEASISRSRTVPTLLHIVIGKGPTRCDKLCSFIT